MGIVPASLTSCLCLRFELTIRIPAGCHAFYHRELANGAKTCAKVVARSMSGISAPAYCQECGRANAASAQRCLWCGVLLRQGHVQRFEPTRVEIGYLGGIDGLEDPTTVSLTISGSGIEVRSLAPGS